MKTILIILLTLTICSCGKDNCQQCTRTWTYKTYVLNSNGSQTNINTLNGSTETFTACGDDMIEAEEKGRTSYAKTPVPSYTNKWNVVEGTGTCDCN